MKKYGIIMSFVVASAAAFSQDLGIEFLESGVLFREGQDSVLFYQTAEKEINGQYKRSNYIHPLFSLDGEVMTEDFPDDHLHHRGIFWAWHQFYIGDKRIGDGWEIKDFRWTVLSVEEKKSKGSEKGILASVLWTSPLWLDQEGNEKPLVNENTSITVFPSEENYRKIDIEISLLAMEENCRIGGSEDEKGYGGFSPRIKLAEDVIFTNEDGRIEPKLLPVEASAWMDVSGSLGREGAFAGVTILSHPENPGYPNPWILRSKRSMQNAVYPYPGKIGIKLSNIDPTILRYRLLIHKGLTRSEISRLHNLYGKGD